MPIPPNELVSLRLRVERLLRGENRAEDLTALFLALRDYSGGRECVVEIGNFVAHRGERRIGIITRETRDFFRTVRFHIAYRKSPLDFMDLPKDFPELLESAFRRTGNDRIRQQLKMNRQQAERCLTELRSRIQPDGNGRTLLTWPKATDAAILKTVLGHITARPAFTNEQLTKQLFEALHANSLARKSELKAFISLSNFIGLFAISNMHLSVIDLKDGTQAELRAGATLSEKAIKVDAAAEVQVNPTGRVFVSSTFFQTDIDVSKFAEPDLFPRSDQSPTWLCHIELNSAGRLARLV